MAEGGKKIVWVLGAGASRGVGAYTTIQKGARIPIPIQTDFWEIVLRFAENDDEDDIVSFLYRYFKGYSKVPPRLGKVQRRIELNGIDVEEVFTFLSERISSPTISDQLREYFRKINHALVRSLSLTFSRYKSSASSKAIFRKFKSNLLRTKDSIISFNYDLILEKNMQNRKYYYYPKSGQQKGIALFKPHGSINFGLDPNDERRIMVYVFPQDLPFIIPPTHLKFVSLKNHSDHNYLDSNDDIASIWEGMEKHLRMAKAIVFIGYSFPDADLYFSSVFRSVLTIMKSEIPIILVNPDALRITEKLTKRFGINRNKVKQHFDFATFCNIKRDDL